MNGPDRARDCFARSSLSRNAPRWVRLIDATRSNSQARAQMVAVPLRKTCVLLPGGGNARERTDVRTILLKFGAIGVTSTHRVAVRADSPDFEQI